MLRRRQVYVITQVLMAGFRQISAIFPAMLVIDLGFQKFHLLKLTSLHFFHDQNSLSADWSAYFMRANFLPEHYGKVAADFEFLQVSLCFEYLRQIQGETMETNEALEAVECTDRLNVGFEKVKLL